MPQGIEEMLDGYPDLEEAWGAFWLSYVKSCEMGTFTPLTLLGSEYMLLQTDTDVRDARLALGLHDDCQFYMVKLGNGDYLEVWGHNGYTYDAKCCLLFRNYGEYEIFDSYQGGGDDEEGA